MKRREFIRMAGVTVSGLAMTAYLSAGMVEAQDKKWVIGFSQATTIEPWRAQFNKDIIAEAHRDAVGHAERFVLVVGDQHEGDADRLLQPAQFDLHLLAQLLVERRQRLVEQQHLWPHHQGAGQRDALALAAGQLVSAALSQPAQRDLRQRLVDAAALLGGIEPQAASARRRRSARR